MEPRPAVALDGPDLATAVARAVGAPVARIVGTRREPLDYDAFLAGRSVTRIRGTAVLDGAEAEWSFIEKLTEGPGVASAYLHDNGSREFAAYQSGLLDDLAPGVAAPGLLSSARSRDGRLTLWIEDVAAGERRSLTDAQLLTAARHLGRMAGRWRDRIPDEPWLFGGWIDRHSQPEAVVDGLATLEGVTAGAEIENRLGCSLDDAKRLINAQPSFKAALERLPTTLCHHDAVAANLFPRVRAGSTQTVLIDWESIGPGPAGADLASLLFSSARRGDLSARAASALLPAALEAYAEGMADVGATVRDSALRLGLFGAISLRWTLVRDVVRVMQGSGTALRGSAPHESPDEALGELIGLVPLLFHAATEATALLKVEQRARRRAPRL